MKYTKQEREEIGRQIFEEELTVTMAAQKYGISYYTACEYLRSYKASKLFDARNKSLDKSVSNKSIKGIGSEEMLKSLSKDELVMEVIKARIDAERAKKVTW